MGFEKAGGGGGEILFSIAEHLLLVTMRFNTFFDLANGLGS